MYTHVHIHIHIHIHMHTYTYTHTYTAAVARSAGCPRSQPDAGERAMHPGSPRSECVATELLCPRRPQDDPLSFVTLIVLCTI